MAFTPGMDREVSVRVNSEGAEGFTSAFDAATASLGKFKMAVGAAGTALAALGAGAMAGSIEAAREFENAMVELEKVANEDVAAELEGTIQDMSEEIPRTQEELAALATDASRFGIEGSENIEKFTRTVAKMATATDLNTSEAGESLAKLSTITDTPTSKIENLGSAVNVMGNEFATSQSEVVESMKRSATAMNSLGLQQTEMVGISTALNEVSASSRRAGTRLRALGNELMSPEAADNFAGSLGMTTDEFVALRENDPSELIRRMAATLNESGSEADRLRSNLRSTSRVALQGLSNNMDGLADATNRSNQAFEDATSLQREFEAQTDTLTSQIQLTRNRIRNIAIDIGQVLMPAVRDGLSAFNDGLSVLAEFNEKTDGMAGAIASVVALIGGLSVAVATLVSGPLGLAVAAIGSFAAAYASNLGGVRDVTNSVVGAVVDAVEQILPPFDEIVETGELVVEIFEDVFAVYADEFEGIGDSAGDAFETVVNAVDDAMPPIEDIQAAIENFGDALVFANRQFARILGELTDRLSGFASITKRRFGIVIDLVRSLVGVFESLGRGVQRESDRIRKATRGLTNTLSGIFDGLLDTLQKITSKINDALAFLVNNLLRPTLKEIGNLYESQYGDLIAETIETVDVVLKRFKALMSALKTAIKPALDAIALFWDTFGDEITAVVEAAFDAIKLVVVSTMDALLTTIRTTLALIRGDWKEAFNILRNFAERRFEGVRDYVTKWGGRFLSAISNAVGEGIDEFKRIVDNGMNTVESRIDDVIDEILGIGDIDIEFPTVPTWLENLLDGTAKVLDVGIDLPDFSWSSYIDDLNWYEYLDDLDWHDWLGYDWQFDWGDFVPSLDWDDFIGDLDDLASFSEGGYVGEGEEGLAMLHGPEYIIPQDEMPSQKVGSRGELTAPVSASMSSSSSSGGGGTTVVIKKIMASGRDEGRRAAKALTAELRSAGLNDPI